MCATCPPLDQLKSFAVGDLSAAGLERIAAHAAECEKCDAALRELDAHADELVGQLKRLQLDPDRESPTNVPQKLLEVARGAGRSNENGESRNVSLDPGCRLSRRLLEGRFRLGRFELAAELGVGSFGHVFRARDTELDRIVALKVQRGGSFASQEDVERFLREARSVAQLKHPGIVAIHDTGRTEDEVCYLVTRK